MGTQNVKKKRQLLPKLLITISSIISTISFLVILSNQRNFFVTDEDNIIYDSLLHDRMLVETDNVREENTTDLRTDVYTEMMTTQHREINEEDNKEEEQKKHEPLNILLIYPDDWRHDSIGHEKSYVQTPFLIELANEGIRFTHNAVTTSICWMSRATLFSGQYSSRHKSYKLVCPEFTKRENWKFTWPSLLREAGYYIGHIGKWQYYSDSKRDFDWSYFFENHHWDSYKGAKVHASEIAKEEALRFFDERPKDKPFALEVMFYPPKPIGDSREPGKQFQPTNETRKIYDNITIPEPLSMHTFDQMPTFLQKGRVAQARFYNRYRTSEHFQESMKNYYALITGVDQACKEIIDKLKAEGLYNNTMIIFTADNGMFHGAHGLAGKWYPYQESIRVPLIIYDPRMPKEKVGTLDDSLTLNIDLAETILGAAGIKPPEVMQGRDISDLYLRNNEKNEFHDSLSVHKQPWRKDFFYEFQYNDDKSIPSSTALVEKGWKYIHWPRLLTEDHDHGYEQIFNLTADPLEMNDLFQNPDINPILLKIRKRHAELREELHDPNYIEDVCHQGKYVQEA